MIWNLLFTPRDSGATNAHCSQAVIDRFIRELDATSVTVPATTLDDLMEEFQIDRCAVLKLDCEGSEYEILRSTNALECIDQVVMELHIPMADLEDSEPWEVRDSLIREISARVKSPPKIEVSSMVSVIAE